jgi:hypothetical protein
MDQNYFLITREELEQLADPRISVKTIIRITADVLTRKYRQKSAIELIFLELGNLLKKLWDLF